MKIITLLTVSFLLTSCSTNNFKSQESLILQAKAYAQQFNSEPNSTRSDLSKYSEGELVESFYFDFSSNRIGHETFKDYSPYKQFLQILEQNNTISYMEARKRLKSNFQNYFAKECASINALLSKVQNLDVKYEQKTYSLDLDSPAYKYSYSSPRLPIYYTIVTGVEEHPIAELYQKAHKAIADCPHSKESGQL